MTQQLAVLVGQDVGVRHEVKRLSAELLLHLDVVEAQSVFPGDLVGVREVVESLELIEAFVEIGLAAAASPEHVPLMRLSVVEPICLAETPHQLRVSFQDLVEQLAVVDVVALGVRMVPVSGSRRCIHQQLVLLDVLKVHVLVHAALYFQMPLSVLEQRSVGGVELAILVEEVLRSPRLSIMGARHEQVHVVLFHVSKQLQHLFESLRPVLLVAVLLSLDKLPLLVADRASARSASVLGVDAVPRLFEYRLDLLESVQSGHFLGWIGSTAITSLLLDWIV